jgi:hypothetical protein
MRRPLGAGLGEVELSLRVEELPDAVAEGRRLGAGYAAACAGGLAPAIRLSAAGMAAVGVLQLRILAVQRTAAPAAPAAPAEDGPRPDVYLVAALVDDKGKERGEPAEMRAVPAGVEPAEVNEYVELLVGADPAREHVRVQLRSSGTGLKRLLASKLIAAAGLSVLDIARGAAAGGAAGAEQGRWLLLREGREAAGDPVFAASAEAAAAADSGPSVLVDWRLALFEPQGERARQFLARIGRVRADGGGDADAADAAAGGGEEEEEEKEAVDALSS